MSGLTPAEKAYWVDGQLPQLRVCLADLVADVLRELASYRDGCGLNEYQTDKSSDLTVTSDSSAIQQKLRLLIAVQIEGCQLSYTESVGLLCSNPEIVALSTKLVPSPSSEDEMAQSIVECVSNQLVLIADRKGFGLSVEIPKDRVARFETVSELGCLMWEVDTSLVAFPTEIKRCIDNARRVIRELRLSIQTVERVIELIDDEAPNKKIAAAAEKLSEINVAMQKRKAQRESRQQAAQAKEDEKHRAKVEREEKLKLAQEERQRKKEELEAQSAARKRQLEEAQAAKQAALAEALAQKLAAKEEAKRQRDAARELLAAKSASKRKLVRTPTLDLRSPKGDQSGIGSRGVSGSHEHGSRTTPSGGGHPRSHIHRQSWAATCAAIKVILTNFSKLTHFAHKEEASQVSEESPRAASPRSASGRRSSAERRRSLGPFNADLTADSNDGFGDSSELRDWMYNQKLSTLRTSRSETNHVCSDWPSVWNSSNVYSGIENRILRIPLSSPHGCLLDLWEDEVPLGSLSEGEAPAAVVSLTRPGHAPTLLLVTHRSLRVSGRRPYATDQFIDYEAPDEVEEAAVLEGIATPSLAEGGEEDIGSEDEPVSSSEGEDMEEEDDEAEADADDEMAIDSNPIVVSTDGDPKTDTSNVTVPSHVAGVMGNVGHSRSSVQGEAQEVPSKADNSTSSEAIDLDADDETIPVKRESIEATRSIETSRLIEDSQSQSKPKAKPRKPRAGKKTAKSKAPITLAENEADDASSESSFLVSDGHFSSDEEVTDNEGALLAQARLETKAAAAERALGGGEKGPISEDSRLLSKLVVLSPDDFHSETFAPGSPTTRSQISNLEKLWLKSLTTNPSYLPFVVRASNLSHIQWWLNERPVSHISAAADCDDAESGTERKKKKIVHAFEDPVLRASIADFIDQKQYPVDLLIKKFVDSSQTPHSAARVRATIREVATYDNTARMWKKVTGQDQARASSARTSPSKTSPVGGFQVDMASLPVVSAADMDMS